MHNRLNRQNDEELYRGLNLTDDESAWVRHYLRVADQVLFGRRHKPRVVVVDDDWPTEPTRPRITPKDQAA